MVKHLIILIIFFVDFVFNSKYTTVTHYGDRVCTTSLQRKVEVYENGRCYFHYFNGFVFLIRKEFLTLINFIVMKIKLAGVYGIEIQNVKEIINVLMLEKMFVLIITLFMM
jgi:hypothetical protein